MKYACFSNELVFAQPSLSQAHDTSSGLKQSLCEGETSSVSPSENFRPDINLSLFLPLTSNLLK